MRTYRVTSGERSLTVRARSFPGAALAAVDAWERSRPELGETVTAELVESGPDDGDSRTFDTCGVAFVCGLRRGLLKA